jgi:hypothetical protein
MKPIDAFNLVAEELESAREEYEPFESAEHGYHIIETEYNDLALEIFTPSPSQAVMKKEATQLAAMAIRFLIDVINP